MLDRGSRPASSTAGPRRVERDLVRRNGRPAGPAPQPQDQQRAEIVDVGVGRPGDHQVVQLAEKAIGVVAIQVLGRPSCPAPAPAPGSRAPPRRRRCPRGRRCRRCRPPAPTRPAGPAAPGPAQAEFRGAPARPGARPALLPHGDRGLAAGEDHAGPGERLPRCATVRASAACTWPPRATRLRSRRSGCAPPGRPRAPPRPPLPGDCRGVAIRCTACPANTRIARLGRLQRAALQQARDRAAAPRCRSVQDRHRVGAGRRVRHGRARWRSPTGRRPAHR